MANGFRRVKLGSLGQFLKGSGISKEDLSPQGVPCLRYAEIYSTYGEVVSKLASRVPATVAATCMELKADDIVFAASGETAEDIGTAIAYIGSEHAVIGGDAIILRGHGQCAEYLAYALGSFSLRRQKYRLGQGQSIVHIKSSDLATLEIDLPPKDQQIRIVEILRSNDEAIAKTDQLIKIKEKSLSNSLDEATRDATTRSLDRCWVRTTLGEVTNVALRRLDWDEKATYRRITVRRGCGGLALRSDALGEEILTKDMYLVKAGDFVISRRQVIHGAWAMARPEFNNTHVSKEYACLTARSERLWMPYLDWLSRTPRLRHEALRCSYGVDPEKMVLNLPWLLKTSLQLPENVERQRKIAEYLDAQHVEIGLLRRQRDALAKQKRGLMQKLLTGEWPVSVPATKEAAE